MREVLMEHFAGSPALVALVTSMGRGQALWDPVMQEELDVLQARVEAERPTLDTARMDAITMTAFALYEVSMMLHGLDLTEEVGLVRNALQPPTTEPSCLVPAIAAVQSAHDTLLATAVENVFIGPTRDAAQLRDKKMLDAGEATSHLLSVLKLLHDGWDLTIAYGQVGNCFSQILKRRNLPWIRRKGYVTQLMENRHERREKE